MSHNTIVLQTELIRTKIYLKTKSFQNCDIWSLASCTTRGQSIPGCVWSFLLAPFDRQGSRRHFFCIHAAQRAVHVGVGLPRSRPGEFSWQSKPLLKLYYYPFTKRFTNIPDLDLEGLRLSHIICENCTSPLQRGSQTGQIWAWRVFVAVNSLIKIVLILYREGHD